ncbi:MAG: O-antigen ligase family protein, partial [Lachnospiraceae bacterium]|nr:O-antigen ligase family protein [Lachnospiraceae bacterium]
TVIGLIRKKLSRPDFLYAGLLLFFFAAIIVFRNGRWWTVVMAVSFTLFYLTYGMWEHKERLLVNVGRGVILQFMLATGFALLHRPYTTYRTARYPHIFHTVTTTAAYLTVVECAALVILLDKMRKSRELRVIWKELVLFGVVSAYMLFTMARTGFMAVGAAVLFAVVIMSRGKGKEKLLNMGRYLLAIIFAVVICFPVTFTVQRTIPALVSEPYMYEFENFRDATLRGRKLNSVEFMRVGRFIQLFGEKIFSIPAGTFDPYGEIEEYKRTHDEFGNEIAVTGKVPDEISDEISNIRGLAALEELVASADYVPEAMEEEQENDYTNGRLDIFRSYIEQLNMTGHEEMGAILKNGEIATHAHNIYLQVAYDHGIPVGILFVLVGIGTFAASCIYYHKKKDIITYAAMPAVVAAAFAVAGMVEWIFHLSHPCGLVLMLVITPLVFREGC